MPDDPKKGLDDLGDWASAIDEWDANLAFGSEDQPSKAEKKAAEKPAPAPAPARSEEPAPLEAAPLDAGTVAEGDDPLMNLFSGDMELPEEAGEALGSLLGDSIPNEPPGSQPLVETNELELEAGFDEFSSESTRVAPADEVSSLLEGLDALEPSAPELKITRDPEPAIEGSPELYTPAVIEMAPDDDYGSDFSSTESTRVASSDDLQALLAGVPELDDDEELARAAAGGQAQHAPTPSRAPVAPAHPVGPALRSPAAHPPAEPQLPEPGAVTDDDFYDDISIEAAREESRRAAMPVPRPVEDAPSEPILVDPPLAVRPDRASDPDRTPLPVADDDALFADSGARPLPVAPPPLAGRAVEAARIAAEIAPPGRLDVPEAAQASALDAAYLRDQLALYDTERLLRAEDPARVAKLACAAARVCERLGDAAGAEERYLAALEIDGSSPEALRGLRRVRLAAGRSDEVLALLDRELERGAPAEQSALRALRPELHLVRGDRDLAREAYGDVLERKPEDFGAALGLADVAAAEEPDALAEALGRVAEAARPSIDGRWKAAIAVERGRLDEAAGRAREAMARFREALELDPREPGALWGLYRVAARTPGEADDVEAHVRLADVLPRGPLRGALERRLGLMKLRANDPAGARLHLQAASADGDALSLLALADVERAEGRLDEAAQALEKVAEQTGDAGRRADLLFTAGELHEERGNTAAAAAAYARAASEYPDDPRAARALERTQQSGGDKEAALQRHLEAAARDSARAPVEWAKAARLAEELGRREEARARLAEALALQPGWLHALDLYVELSLADGRVEDAAQALGRAADATEEAPLQAALRERAARLYARAGRREEAVGAVHALVVAAEQGGHDVQPLRWLEERLLVATVDAPALADRLRDEAEAEGTEPARAHTLWLRRAFLLGNVDAAEAAEAARRALELDGASGPAAVELAWHLPRAGRASELPSVWQARAQAANGRAEAHALSYRLAIALADDAGDLAAAQKLAAERAAQLPDDLAAPDLVQRLARRAGDDAVVLAALERELAEAQAPELRFALLIAIGERLEKRGQPERAVDRFHKALEAHPGHPLARVALDRACREAGQFSLLADLALADLKDATDARTKVDAYERLAVVDGELRGDRESALLAMQSIVEIDHAHHGAMRVLEREYLREQRWPELLGLYEQLGLTANDPRFAAAIHLDRARLRMLVQRGAADKGMGSPLPENELQAAIANDHRLALFKNPYARSSLRHGLGRALLVRDLAQVAELEARLAEAVGDDARTAAVCLTRAAEALEELERPDEARARFEAALQRLPQHVPALEGLLELTLATGDWAGAAQAAERAGDALKDVDARSDAWLLAGAIAEEKLSDPARARRAFEAALAVEPRNRAAFDRLRRVLDQLGDHAALADTYRKRLEVETDGVRLTRMHLELARLARDKLGDRDRARAELKAVLAQEAGHIEALTVLADLDWEDGRWADAAETLIKRARLEKTRDGLKAIFFRLGIIYADKLPDTKRALASFQRVVKADPNDLVALEHLSNLYLKEWDYKGALDTTRHLAEVEKDRSKRIAALHRIAKIYEEGFKDARNALAALRAALELDPMHLGSIGELARFFDRQSDVQSMRVHLDRTGARVRTMLEKDPWDATALHALVKIFGWRRAPDRAAMAAGVLEYLGQADAEEKQLLQKVVGRDPYPGSALADPALDDNLFDARVPAGFRHLFRLLDEPLGKAFRGDVKRLGVTKQERLPRSGHAVRDVANRIAADLGLRDFDLYLTAQHPTALMVELTEPLSVIVGAKLVEGAHEHEVRFLLGRALKMAQAHMTLPLRLSAEELGLLVGALVRQFVPEFVPAGFEEKQVVEWAGRVSKVVPKKLQAELFPFAMECASPELDLRQLAPALIDASNRAGLLACGLIAPAISALKRLGDDAQVRWLVRFAMSDELAELRRQAGTSIG